MTVLPNCVAALNVLSGTPFYDSCSSVSDVVDAITDNMNFCVLPKLFVQIYPNEKLWMAKDVKKLLKAKQYALQTGDRISLKIAQAELIALCKEV